MSWTYHGRQVRMPPSYERALRALEQPQPAAAFGPGASRSRCPGGRLAPWDEDEGWAPPPHGETTASLHSSLAAAGALRVGAEVRIAVRGKYAGLVGRVEKVGRTRYRVRTSAGLLTVSFPGVGPIGAG